MKTLSVSKFRANCSSALKYVYQNKTRILITKRGKPIAEVIPFEADHDDIPLKNTATFIGDIVSPVAEDDWEALK